MAAIFRRSGRRVEKDTTFVVNDASDTRPLIIDVHESGFRVLNGAIADDQIPASNFVGGRLRHTHLRVRNSSGEQDTIYPIQERKR